MSKVTRKLQVTIPKAIAERFGIRPGDDLEWRAAGGTLCVVPSRAAAPRLSIEERLKLFRAATGRQRRRNGLWAGDHDPEWRGWRRDDLHLRGSAD